MAIRDYRPETRAPEGVGTPEISLERAGQSAGIRSLGDAITDFGAIIETANQEAQANRARLALTEGMGQLNMDLAGDTDPASMMDRYQARLGDMTAQIMGGVSSDRVKSVLALELAQAKVAAEARVFTRQRELAGSDARATVAAQLRASANEMPVAATEAEARVIYDRAQASIASMEAAGYIDAEGAERLRQGFDGDVAQANVLSALNADPAAALDVLQAPGAFGLDEIERQQYLGQAQRITEQRAEQGAALIDRRLGTARDVLVRGGTVAPEELAQLAADVAGTPDEARLAGAVAASRRLGGFASAAPDARAAEIAALTARGVSLDSASTDGAELATLQDIDASVSAAVARDPVAFAIAQGFEGAAPLDLGDPASVTRRMGLVTYLRERHGAPARVFTDEERTAYTAALDTGEPDAQLALVTTIIDGMGAPAATVAFTELGGVKPAVRMAGELVLDTGRTDTAAAILSGLKAIEEGDESRIPSADALAVFEETVDGVVGLVAGRRERVIAGARAYYAAKAPGRVTSADVQDQADLLAEGIDAVLGQTRDNGTVAGGIGRVNGARVRLPPGTTAEGIEAVLNTGDREPWLAGSLSGGLPHWGQGEAEAWEPVVPDDAQLRWVSGTIYAVGRSSRRGGWEQFRDPGVEGELFYVDLAKMAGQAARGPVGPPVAPPRRRAFFD